MNRVESRFAVQLEQRRMAGEIAAWVFEPVKLRIGIDWKCTLTVDFLVILPDGSIELVDVKGGAGWEEDARVKMRAAARLFPWFLFVGYKERELNNFYREEFAAK